MWTCVISLLHHFFGKYVCLLLVSSVETFSQIKMISKPTRNCPLLSDDRSYTVSCTVCIIILSFSFSLVHRRTSQLSPVFTVMEPYHAGKQQIDVLVRIKEVHWGTVIVTSRIKIDLVQFIVVRYTSYSEPLCIQSRKPFPGTFLPENLEHFSQKKKFFFSKFGLSIKSWILVPPPPPPHTHTQNGNFGIYQIWTRHQIPQHPPPPAKWEFWILANLNSASNSANPPPPTHTRIGKCANHFEPLTGGASYQYHCRE